MALVLAEELSEREAYVKSLQDYQVNFQSDLAALLERLNWTPQHFLEQESAKVTCSNCPNHKMPVESLKKHDDICQLIQKGYTIEELEKEAPSSAFFYEKSKISTIKLEKDAMNAILNEHRRQMGSFEMKNPPSSDRDVPQTLAASQIFFSPSERLAIYESVVRMAKESQRMQSMPEDILLTVDFEALIKKSAKSKETGEPCSEAEKWAAMRDYKRRRQSYRAKNVHITKKTYTEIIREVIHNQVDLLQEVIKNEENDLENKNTRHDSSSDAERRAKRNSEGKSQPGSSSRRRDWESPDRRKRETNKSDPRSRDQKSPDKRRRDRDSPRPRKRDRKSPESRNYRSRDSPNQRRSRSSPYSRKRDRKSPDTRKRDKDDLDRRRSKKRDSEESRKCDREHPEGALSRNKSPDHKKRKQEGESADDERMAPKERHELEAPSAGNDNVRVEHFGNMNESLSLKRLSSGDDSGGSSSPHRHRQKHKKSKKHKKHKHKSEKQER